MTMVHPRLCCAVAELVQGRFPEDPHFLATLVTTLLNTTTSSTTGNPPTTNSTTTPNHGPWDYEQLALQLLDRCDAAGAALRGSAGPKQQVAAALYAAGVGHFKGKRFGLAVQLLVASLTYTEVRLEGRPRLYLTLLLAGSVIHPWGVVRLTGQMLWDCLGTSRGLWFPSVGVARSCEQSVKH
jgi:hypothetical protein